MARTNATNFTGPLQFPYATAAADLFKKEDIQTLAQAVDQHNHSAGKGLVLDPTAIPAGSITSAMIADGTIDTVDLKDGSITSAKIADGTIDTVDLKDGSVTTAKILDGTIATADIAAGAITTPKLAANAASQRIGNYGAVATFSSTTTSTWLATPVSTGSITTSGLLTRMDGTLAIKHTAAAQIFVGFQQDGAQQQALAMTSVQVAGNTVNVAFTYYFIPPAGAHTFTISLFTGSGGTLSLETSVAQYLNLTEIRA
jgi:hypothetical protein